MKKKEKCAVMWKKYCKKSEMCRINRAGFGRLGYVPVCEAKSAVYAHPENDGEHSFSVINLLSLSKDFFPKKFKTVTVYSYDAGSNHEIGELKIMDLCDDGSQDVSAKDAAELKEMKKYLKGFPKKARKKHLKQFKALQRRKDSQVYLVDKFDFILRQLYLIKKGFDAVSMENKIQTGGLSPSDEKYIELTGSHRAIDICFAHALDNTRGIRGRDVLIGMVEAAYADVGMVIPLTVKNLY